MQSGIDSPTQREQLVRLADLLGTTRPLWDQRPFRERPAPWESTMPVVSAWLRGLSAHEIDALESDPFGGPPMPPALAALRDAATDAASVPSWTSTAHITHAPMRRVKGRKQAQIIAFQRVVHAPLHAAAPRQLVDWCGGKGHLSRALGRACGCSVCVVDLVPNLVADAEILGRDAGLTVHGVAADVTRMDEVDDASAESATVTRTLADGAALVGLHACGLLTDAAIDAAITYEVPWLALVPCCHHRVPQGGWRPKSAALKATGLHLNVNGLRLAIADEGPASASVRARRRKEMCWRIAVDMLIVRFGDPKTETVLGQGEARQPAPMGVIRRPTYRLSFEDFCRTTLATRGIILPRGWDADAHLADAVETTRIVRGLSLVRGQLRRAVEVLCVLDRAQALREAGWRVQVGTFCDRSTTPRNLLLMGER